MKRFTLTIAIFLALPAIGLSDVCTDVQNAYNQQILQLRLDSEAAIQLTTDPGQQAAIWASYEAQKTRLEAQRDASLSSLGCSNGDIVDNPGDPDPDPDDPDPDDPGDDPDDDDPGIDPDEDACKALIDRLRLEGLALQGNKPGFDKAAKYIRAHKEEVKRVCGNYGGGRRHYGGKSRDHEKKKCLAQKPRNDDKKHCVKRDSNQRQCNRRSTHKHVSKHEKRNHHDD